MSNQVGVWAEYCAAESRMISLRMQFFREYTDEQKVTVLRENFFQNHGAVLRILLLCNNSVRHALLPQLLSSASVGHALVSLSREVLALCDREWFSENAPTILDQVLSNAGEEEYRRIAELLVLLDSRLLAGHVARALNHSDPEIQEVGLDFQDLSTHG